VSATSASLSISATRDIQELQPCRFRLRTLHDEANTFHDVKSLLPFLLQQTKIQDWRAGGYLTSAEPSLGLHFPPNMLSIAQVQYIHNRDEPFLRIITSHHLVRLSLNMQHVVSHGSIRETMEIVSQCRQSLSHLHIRLGRFNIQALYHPWSPVDIVEVASEFLPELKYLSYAHPHNDFWVSLTLDRNRTTLSDPIG
jgi:hypothetical protein